ncbi:MAG: hypothetical protein IV088_15455 [Hydrogenophaga sp.]|uniref:hypothetical protein n=1 Tax=Hydrogenophaga sp. TaxID=1904254 RepID=UPI0025C0E1DA|nr:hypothetical protein [Hydrogenophaga sp.]MBT9552245.1 hypothetical protein [Hydrogenophaga sp.]
MKTKQLGALLLSASLVACGQLPLDFLQAQHNGLETLSQQIGPNVGRLHFDFEFDDKADAAEGEIGSGYIVVSRAGKELQALPHAFEMPRNRLDREAWLDFKDFNGDGLLDFKVTRLFAMDGKLPVDSLYQFDAKTGTFAQVDLVSNAGAIEATAPGCVSLTLVNAAGNAKQESHCFVPTTARWVRAKAEVAQKGAAAARVEAVCDPLVPDLIGCRRARIEQDRVLLTMVREYRMGKKQALIGLQGKAYADAYVKTQDLDHQSWHRYRDARCAAQAREQAVAVKALPAAIELCRHDWSRDQLRRYKEQVARLGEGKSKP